MPHLFYRPKMGVNAIKTDDLPQKMHVFLDVILVVFQLPLKLDDKCLFFCEFQVVHHQSLQQFYQVRVHMFRLGIKFCPFTTPLLHLLVNLQRKDEKCLIYLFLLGEIPFLRNITMIILLIVATQRYHLVQPTHDHEVAFALFKGIIKQSGCWLEAYPVHSCAEINDKLPLYVRGAEYFLSLAFTQAIFLQDRLVVRIQFVQAVVLEFFQQLLRPLVMKVRRSLAYRLQFLPETSVGLPVLEEKFGVVSDLNTASFLHVQLPVLRYLLSHNVYNKVLIIKQQATYSYISRF